MKQKLKHLSFSVLAVGAIAIIVFNFLKKRHQEEIKSKIFYALNLVDSKWEKDTFDDKVVFTSPTFVISDIYKSMQGPVSNKFIVIDESKEELLWLTSFKTGVISTNEKDTLSNDFVCHTNFEYRDAEHFNRFDMMNRVDEKYPRITSISNGIKGFTLPEGYGFPVYSNERLFINAQALNHNISDSIFNIKHKIEIGYTKHSKKALKPLQPQTIFMMFPYDKNDPFRGPTEELPNACVPVEKEMHTYLDENGDTFSGHWVVSPGKHSYTYNINKQLNIKDSIRLHQITPHVHPFAETFILKNKTTDSIIFKSETENYKDKIGLKNASLFFSDKGLWMHKNHDYEMILKVNNTSDVEQEMMGSIAIFYYDDEMDNKIKSLN